MAKAALNIELNILPAVMILCPLIITVSKSCLQNTPGSICCHSACFYVAGKINFQCIKCCALQHVKHLYLQAEYSRCCVYGICGNIWLDFHGYVCNYQRASSHELFWPRQISGFKSSIRCEKKKTSTKRDLFSFFPL